MAIECKADRQITYWGKENQEVIEQGTIAIIGLGGLGSIAAELLCRMRVGTLLLCDFDIVTDHNLSRQHLYTTEDINQPKVLAAKTHLQKINPSVNIKTMQTKANQENLSWCAQANIVLDCTDNHNSRREIDVFCKKNKVAWIHGAAIKEHGSVFAFLPTKNISYEDIYTNKTTNFTCKEHGVLATIVSIVGSYQASFAIQYLLKREIPETLLRIYSNSGQIEHIQIREK
ncbi:HesA/MoeB/ThiF family protein [Candidatus Woesearchaeota archaeon]|nr:HesA/MoeB/ThiF family protein [Candidatus Woesearchaeota archaeon]